MIAKKEIENILDEIELIKKKYDDSLKKVEILKNKLELSKKEFEIDNYFLVGKDSLGKAKFNIH